jgi:Ca2+-binding RTX toxin-like protein
MDLGSIGGEDTLLGADGVGSITYLTGDALISDASCLGGNDTLISGKGNDHMWGDFGGKDNAAPLIHGQSGTDLFVFSANNGKDIIYDFNDGKDTIKLSGIAGVANFNELSPKISTSGLNSVITFDSNNTITLIGIATSLLTEADFSFA